MNFDILKRHKQLNQLNMDKMSPVNKNKMLNAECCKYDKQKKKLNDASFGERARITVNAYKEKKKENQSEAEKVTHCEKERIRKYKYKF